MDIRPIIILAEPIEDSSRDWLANRVDLVEAAPGEPAFLEALPLASGMVIRTGTIVDESMLSAAPRLQAVARAGVGLDNIDQAACARHEVAVLHTPGANTQAVVEYVMTLVMDSLRPREVLSEAIDVDSWNELRSSARTHKQMSEYRFGILGFGRIGQRVAEVASAVGFSTCYTDLLDIAVSKRHGARPLQLEELLSNSDILSIHVDGRASNRGLLGASRLRLLPKGALLVNTARGFVIDEQALVHRLEEDLDFQAILDVHEHEPIPSSCPLLGLPNVTLLPHTAARTTQALSNMSRVVEDLVGHLDGR